MTGTRIDVNTLSDMDRMSGEVSERSFWNVLIDSKSRSELVAALTSQRITQIQMETYYLSRKM